MKNRFQRIAILGVASLAFSSVLWAQRVKQPFNDNWTLYEVTADVRDSLTDNNLTLPHDWSLKGPFLRNAPAGNDGGYLPTGRLRYTKSFFVPATDSLRRHTLYFEGVYHRTRVLVNGKLAGKQGYGYSTFALPISHLLRYGADNTVEVEVDNSTQKNSRWYTGTGIYRPVYLLNTDSVSLPLWGTYVYSEQQSATDWILHVQTQLASAVRTAHRNNPDAQVSLRITLRDGKVHRVARSESEQQCQQLCVKRPKLWSPKHPTLYTLDVELLVDGHVRDNEQITTAFRTISVDAERGLVLNGEPLELNGGCVHHDNGILGATSNRAIETRKVALLKRAGFNAVRTSHNPPSEDFLNECDRQGLLVIDEAFDNWRQSKTAHDYHELFDTDWQHDLDAMVLRDRNHPSIFCWSIGNEVIERKEPQAVTTARHLAQRCRMHDPHRPITSGITTWDNTWAGWADSLGAQHDIFGFNYQMHRAEGDHRRIPQRVMMQTESYPRDTWKNYEMVTKHPYLIGDFVWTALDYIGESGIGRHYYQGQTEGEHYQRDQYPWHGAYCGDVDLTGQRKAISLYRSLLYNGTSEAPLYIAVREPDEYYGQVRESEWGTWPTWQRWNWPGHEGREIAVEVYSHYPTVELYLNEKLVGTQPAGIANQCKAVFHLPYHAGVLKAKAYDAHGILQGESILCTAGQPATMQLNANKHVMQADGQDVVFVEVQLTDADGIAHPSAELPLDFSVEGAAEIAATGNANLQDGEPYVSHRRTTWNGRALCVLRSNGRRGDITLTVKCNAADGPQIPVATLRLKAK